MNTKEFTVGHYRVDMGRSQIVANDAIVSMEPKVLQVLLILAENQGQVVTHDEFLSKVWPNVEVAPNTLQRCVAQLRKAFNDDAKLQRVIATHPKVGYSLLANVDWQHDLESSKNKSTLTIPFGWVATGFILMGILIVGYLSTRSQSGLPITQLTQLTSTDNKEFSPSFSPNGQYIAFQRFEGICENHLWAKDLTDHKEYRLTKDPGIYGDIAWSPNGEQIAFSNITHCRPEKQYQGCTDIRTLSFPLAKSSPQTPVKVLACDEKDYSAVVWLTNDEIAFFESDAEHRTLMSFSLSDAIMTPLYSHTNFTPHTIDYSQRTKKLAISQFDSEFNGELVLFDPDTKTVETITLNPPSKFRHSTKWNLSWHTTDDKLLAAFEKSLFEIDLNGEFIEYPLTMMNNIWGPKMSPDGRSIVASVGVVDLDIAEMSFSSEHLMKRVQEQEYQIKYRSINVERDSQYQPSTQNYAFISNRTGSDQVWLSGDQPLQLTHYSNNQVIQSFVWSHDGKFIMLVMEGGLHILTLDGKTQAIETDFKVHDIYQRLDEHELLLNVVMNQQKQVMLFNLQSGKRQSLFKGQSRWAQLDSYGRLYIKDVNRKFFSVKDNQKITIDAVDSLYPEIKFHIKNDALYFLDINRQLRSYDVLTGGLNVVLESVPFVKYIDDIDLENQQILFTYFESARKEIVLFSK